MQFTREINRLLRGILVLFGVVALGATYWAVVGPDTILQREDNPRLVLAEASILRGAIVDRNGEVLARTFPNGDGTAVREYLYPETNGALGYYSLRYGVSGAEAAYDATLRGDTVIRSSNDVLMDSLLHRPQTGSDVQLTLDLGIQRAVAQALAGRRGAAVVLSVPDGQVLAMVSNPTYDPNLLDAQWDELTADPGKPFFNRVIQGNYQPGGTLETALIAAAVVDDMSLSDADEDATVPVTVDDLEISCAVRLRGVPLSLRESYGFACPKPFVELAEQLGENRFASALRTFHFGTQPTLPGYVAPTEATPAPESGTPVTTDGDNLIESAVGQGPQTISPLQMAMMAAAIVNDGNAPQPYTLLATRAPGATEWALSQEARPTLPYATANTARQLQDLMRYAVANGAAQNAGRPNLDVGGHATLAYSGEETQAWFVGFATLAGRQGIAVAVVLEASADPGLAADIGGRTLAAAQQALQPPQPTQPAAEATATVGG